MICAFEVLADKLYCTFFQLYSADLLIYCNIKEIISRLSRRKKRPEELRRISKWRDQRFPLSREAPFHLSYLSLIFSTHLLHLLFLAAFVFSSALDIPAVTSATRFLPLLFFPLCRIIGIMLSPPPPPPIMIFNISLPPRDLNVRH